MMVVWAFNIYVELRSKMKSLGGKWNGKIKCWELQYKQIKALNLKREFCKKDA